MICNNLILELFNRMVVCIIMKKVINGCVHQQQGRGGRGFPIFFNKKEMVLPRLVRGTIGRKI
jgi:hypothetical protein